MSRVYDQQAQAQATGPRHRPNHTFRDGEEHYHTDEGDVIWADRWHHRAHTHRGPWLRQRGQDHK